MRGNRDENSPPSSPSQTDSRIRFTQNQSIEAVEPTGGDPRHRKRDSDAYEACPAQRPLLGVLLAGVITQ